MTDSHPWEVSNARFLLGYAVLCAVTLGGIWLRRRRLLNAGDGSAARRSFDAYEVAMLNGGPQLAITIAAAELHRVGSLAWQGSGRVLKVRRRPDRAADGTGELEEDVFEAVLGNPGVHAGTLRRQLATCASVRRLAATLVDAGLLLDDRRRAQVNRLWIWAVPLVGLGIARVVAVGDDDAAVTHVTMMLLAPTLAALGLAMQRPWATARGRRLLKYERAGRRTLGHIPSQAEIPAAVALFGAGALWVADPDIAFAWAVPRERGSTLTGTADGEEPVTLGLADRAARLDVRPRRTEAGGGDAA
jgi:uncharacterized protein (TIGR04222 family)